MVKIEVGLYDSLMTELNKTEDNWSLTGAACSPKKVQWNYFGGIQDCAVSPAILPEDKPYITVFTDKDIASPFVGEIESKYKVVFLNECRQVHPFAYKWILSLENNFDFVVTHDESLLSRGPKYLKVASPGTTWIPDEKSKVYDKTKLLSHIASDKAWCQGHRLRHIITKMIENRFDVDFWGSSFEEFEKKDKYLCLKDYCFSITVMNAKIDNYFTETLVDTFRCGTIPIFWGCENLGEYFNEKGVLRFNNPKELIHILENLSEEKYYEMLPYAKENFNTAKNYTQIDDTVLEVILRAIERNKNAQ